MNYQLDLDVLAYIGSVLTIVSSWMPRVCRPSLRVPIVRYHHFGEGEYDKDEAVIQTLLAEAGSRDGHVPQVFVNPRASGVPAAAGLGDT